METESTPGDVRLNNGLGPLVACPLCGAESGYKLSDGSTYRWWYVSCAACGDELGECSADRTHKHGANLPTRWQFADEHWNRVGAHAQRLRDFLVTIRDTGMSADDAAQHAADALRGPNVALT
jgi:phage terminase large subunit GpA-like protein